MAFQFDWPSMEDRLYEQSKSLIQQFATEHPDVTCSFFAYDTNPAYGEFLLSFDTVEHMLEMAQQEEQRAIARREQTLNQEWSWRIARSKLRSVRDSSPNGDYFAYHIYAALHVQE